MTVFVLVTSIVAAVPAVILLRQLRVLRTAGYRKRWGEILVTLWIGYTLARMAVLLLLPGLNGWWMAALCIPLLVLLVATVALVRRDMRRAEDVWSIQATRPTVKTDELEMAERGPETPK